MLILIAYQDLDFLGITKPGHRKKLLLAAQNLGLERGVMVCRLRFPMVLL